MDRIRGFSLDEAPETGLRQVQDAPAAMRQEIVAALYTLADHTSQFGGAPTLDVDRDLYLHIEQSLGVQAAGNPQAGRRQRIGKDIGEAHWTRVYDLIVGLWPEFFRRNAHEEYRSALNRILTSYRVAWDLGRDGFLHRVLPQPAVAQIASAFYDLADPAYAAALALAKAAQDAYDARPRRDRDACSNGFDAMESIAKTKFNMPAGTFYDVLKVARANKTLNPVTIDVLEKMNTVRNQEFGHGMVAGFALSSAEVDFTYLTCIAGITLFARLSSSPAALP